MRAFIFALQFLTIIPLKLAKPPERKDYTGALLFFPVVGFLLAALLIGTNVLLALIFPPLLVSLFLVIMLTILTGGLHLDGLADTFDALGSRKKPEEMLAVMRDSSTGVMGVLSIVSVFLIKVFILAYLPHRLKSFAIVGMLVTARWSMTIVMRFFKYARPQGKAGEFVQNMSTPLLIATTYITTIIAAVCFGIPGIAMVVACALAVLVFSYFVSAKIGGITGDVLGAVNEISECVFLIAAYLILRPGGMQ